MKPVQHREAERSGPLKRTTRPSRAKRAGPGDIPASRPIELDRFDALIGTWEMEAAFGTPPTKSRGACTTFEWLEGGFFLTQRFRSDHPAAPSGVAIIGPGSQPGSLEQHYYDSRGVARTYRTTIEENVWRVWREEPGFWQRYVGELSADGRQIVGAWESSPDGREWTRDFGLNYLRKNP